MKSISRHDFSFYRTIHTPGYRMAWWMAHKRCSEIKWRWVFSARAPGKNNVRDVGNKQQPLKSCAVEAAVSSSFVFIHKRTNSYICSEWKKLWWKAWHLASWKMWSNFSGQDSSLSCECMQANTVVLLLQYEHENSRKLLLALYLFFFTWILTYLLSFWAVQYSWFLHVHF